MTVYRLADTSPDIDPTAFVHPDAVVIGAVTIGPYASIWPTAVLRADFGIIEIGARTSVQDGTVVHASHDWPTVIGADCVVGHNAHLEGAVIGDGCLVGSMSTCLQRVTVGSGSLIAAAALLTEGTTVPASSRALGAPARIAPHRDSKAFARMLADGVQEYLQNSQRYKQHMSVVDLR